MSAFDRGAVMAARNAIDKARAAVDLVDGDSSWGELCRRVNPAEAINDLRHERVEGAAREVREQLDKRQQRSTGNSTWPPGDVAYHSHRYRREQTRADLAGTTTSGGYLVETANWPSAAQALMSMLVLGRLGATSVDASGGNVNLPKVTTSSSTYWLSTETSQLSESDETFGQLAFSPHTVGGYTEMSHLIGLQSMPNAAGVVSNDLSRKIARTIEAAAFNGSGVAGQPHGIIGLTGINTVSGTTYALATGMTATTDTGDALTDDASPGWVTTRAVASLLRQRQEFSGSPLTLWRGALTWGELHDFPAAATSGMPSATALFGAWRFLVVVNWAGGLEVSVNPYTPVGNFQSGILGLRAFATLDIGVFGRRRSVP